jgi:hypothetical protein
VFAGAGAAVAAIATVVVGVLALPASAHSTAGLPSTDWRSRAIAVRVGGEVERSLAAHTSDLGQHLTLTTAPDESVVVLGYRGEPYLWFTRGRVLENLRAPSAWLSRQKNVDEKVPAGYSASAAPLWRTVSTSSSYRWHDLRVHATAHDNHSRSWTIPIVVDQHAGAIEGRLDLVAGPALLLPLLAIVLGAAAVVVIARRSPHAMSVIALVVAVGAATQLVGTWRATTATLWQRLGPSSYAILAVVAAVMIAASARSRDRARYPEALLLGGVVLAVTGGLAHIDWLTHSQLPTALAPALARGFLIAQLATGVGSAIAGVILLEARAREEAPVRAVSTASPAPPVSYS